MLDFVEEKLGQHEAFRAEVLAGLSQPQKTLPSRWLYDQRGSELFEEITRLDEYYLTRTETAILRRHAGEMAALCGERAVLLEYGAGAAIKSEILLDALHAPRMYAPIDIAADFLSQTVERFRDRFPDLPTRPIITDFTADFDIPGDVPASPRAAFFPGSTLGNLLPADACALLRRMREHVGPRGKAIIGVDLRKDIQTLIAAYDDKLGVTAEFNLNLLIRINRELQGDFDSMVSRTRRAGTSASPQSRCISSAVSLRSSLWPGPASRSRKAKPSIRRLAASSTSPASPIPRKGPAGGWRDLERSGKAFRGVRPQRGGVSLRIRARCILLNG